VLIGGGAPAGKIKLVHSGINTSRFKGVSPDRTLRAQFGFPSDCLLVGNIAKLAGYKDHPTLLRAAKVVCDKLPNARFLIVGEGEEKRKLESLKNELGLEGKLVFAGFRKDVPRILATLDLFVMSSHMEGLGTTVLDAMAASLPVVATHAGGIPEAVKDGKTGILVPKRQPERLAEGIISLLRDPDLRKKMGQAGAQRVDRKFSAEAMVEGNLRVYREVCNIQSAPDETERGAHS
jgi:glycosyltransferase involved in cell wall biosynthesis